MTAIEERVEVIDRLLRAHAGGLELQGVSADGVVSLRYSGMCTGCPLRPLTTAATVRPALLDLRDVRDIEIVGGRTSDQAQRRIAAALGDRVACPGLGG